MFFNLKEFLLHRYARWADVLEIWVRNVTKASEVKPLTDALMRHAAVVPRGGE